MVRANALSHTTTTSTASLGTRIEMGSIFTNKLFLIVMLSLIVILAVMLIIFWIKYRKNRFLVKTITVYPNYRDSFTSYNSLLYNKPKNKKQKINIIYKPPNILEIYSTSSINVEVEEVFKDIASTVANIFHTPVLLYIFRGEPASNEYRLLFNNYKELREFKEKLSKCYREGKCNENYGGPLFKYVSCIKREEEKLRKQGLEWLLRIIGCKAEVICDGGFVYK